MKKELKKFYKKNTSRRTRKIVRDGFESAGGTAGIMIAAGKGLGSAIKDFREEKRRYDDIFDATTVNAEILKLGIEMGILSEEDDKERFIRTSSDIGSLCMDEENLQLSEDAMILLYTKRICGMALVPEEQEKELFIAYINGRRAKE